jgi:predicted nucleotidyltransferase
VRRAARLLVRRRGDIEAVYLFGSLAEGRAVPGSDADVLILLRQSAQRWVDRPLEFYRYFDGVGLPVDLLCYTVEEAQRNPFAQDALRDGICLARP